MMCGDGDTTTASSPLSPDRGLRAGSGFVHSFFLVPPPKLPYSALAPGFDSTQPTIRSFLPLRTSDVQIQLQIKSGGSDETYYFSRNACRGAAGDTRVYRQRAAVGGGQKDAVPDHG